MSDKREILFRGKRADKGEWIEGYHAVIGERVVIIEYPEMFYDSDGKECHGNTIEDVAPETVCQYTGLADENGKKIFEGDIVRDHGNAYIVFWDSGNCEVGIKNTEESFGIAYLYPGDMEVIGNIFDDPELVERRV